MGVMSDALTNTDVLRLGAVADQSVTRSPLDQEVTLLFEQWRPALLKYVSTFGLLPHDSEEIVQEVFLSLFSHLKKEKSRANLRGWLFRVARSRCLDEPSRRCRRAQTPFSSLERDDGEEERLPFEAIIDPDPNVGDDREDPLLSLIPAPTCGLPLPRRVRTDYTSGNKKVIHVVAMVKITIYRYLGRKIVEGNHKLTVLG